MNTLVPFIRLLGRVPVAVASAVLFGLMVMTFFDVLLRSAANAPIEAAPELTRMSIAIIVFASLPVVSFRGDHISVDLLDGVFERFGIMRLWNALISIFCGVILWWPANRVIDLAERARSYGDLTEFLSIPTFYIGWMIAIMTFATMAALILRGLTLLFFPKLMDPDT